MKCPVCSSLNIIKNGSIHNGKQKYFCKDCRRQFVENPENKRIAPEIWNLVNRLLLEKISIAGIARVVGISELWLQKYINVLYQNISKIIEHPDVTATMILECDEMWSFVGRKENKQWIWLAIDRNSRKIVGVHVGSRDRKGAQALWDSLPQVYRECDICYTDFWSAYNTVIPDKCHKAVGKETGKTNHIERFNNTMRQRISRLVRGTLSFSKNINNHIGAIWNFVHHYNANIAPKLATTTC